MSFRGSLNKHPSLTPPSGNGGGGWTVIGGRRGSFKSLTDGDFFLKHRTERQEEDPYIAKQTGVFLLVLNWYDLGKQF